MSTKVTSEVLYLKYEFNDTENLAMAHTLASNHNALDDIDAEEAVFKSQVKERRASLQQSIQTLSRSIATGFEMRNIPCHVLWDSPNVGEVQFVRKDTGEIARTRPMTEQERQLDLPLSSEEGVVSISVGKSLQNVDTFFKGATDNGESVAESSEEVESVAESDDDVAEDDNLLDPKYDPELSAVDAPKVEEKRGRGRPRKAQSLQGFSGPTNATAIQDEF